MVHPAKIVNLKRYFPGSVLDTGYAILLFWVVQTFRTYLELSGKAPFRQKYLRGFVSDAHRTQKS